MSDRVEFSCDGRTVAVDVEPAESLLTVLRERLGVISVKDGCAPQGQCGCCTVLLDGAPRVACVTPATRAAGRTVTTVDGLDADVRARLADAFVASGGSQCGFCTPGILVRAAPLVAGGEVTSTEVDRALAAHLCRCTGWTTVREAIVVAASASTPSDRDLETAAQRAALEGGVAQRVGRDVPLGRGGFADDTAPRDALVAVPSVSGSAPPGAARTEEACGQRWIVGESLAAARAAAGKVQGRRTTVAGGAPLPLPELPPGGVRLATSWVEPAYLEPDASWCEPAGQPATPLANGGAFGAKVASLAPRAARELADRLGCTVHVVLAREDVVRLGPKRPPVAATAWVDAGAVRIEGMVAGDVAAFADPRGGAVAALDVNPEWRAVTIPGPPTSSRPRATGLAEQALLVEGAIAVAGLDRTALVHDERTRGVALDTCVGVSSGALAGARVELAEGLVERVVVRVAAGDPLDAVVLRSYAVGAAHMALGWVFTEGLTVDATTGAVLDLTIRSFGVIAASRTPPIEVVVVDEPGPPLAAASDAVFAAVAASAWNAVTRAEGRRPETFPALETTASRALRR